MPVQIIIGAQWGDEGKGRVVDLLASQADVVARFNGGDNAGHTVTVKDRTFKLHLIPSGIIHPHTTGVIGNGVVINPVTLLQEMEMLRSAGVTVNPERLALSHAAHLITPGHRALDAAQEQARGAGKIGTTGRGIGPVYTDKAARRGLRLEDMLDPQRFIEKLENHLSEVNTLLARVYSAQPLDGAAILSEYGQYARTLAPYIKETSILVGDALKAGKIVLAEGAQGTLLDLDHGTYPFVTSSYTTAPGALIGLGIGLCPVGRVIGVTKAFQTRVGAGPFPTEVFEETALQLRGTGANPWDEFGTTTGRPRRVGWLDGVLLRYAARINGLTELTLTKLDVLTGLPTIKLCTAYRTADRTYCELPLGPADLSPFEPVYEEIPGWSQDLRGVSSWEALPARAQEYIRRVEALCGLPVRLISVGPERSQIVMR